jgi:predicted RNase H-like HicB family nuclease
VEKTQLTAVVWKEDDMFVAECAEIGTISQGCTRDEALVNLQEATQLYLDEIASERRDAAQVVRFEVVKR